MSCLPPRAGARLLASPLPLLPSHTGTGNGLMAHDMAHDMKLPVPVVFFPQVLPGARQNWGTAGARGEPLGPGKYRVVHSVAGLATGKSRGQIVGTGKFGDVLKSDRGGRPVGQVRSGE